jgi:hypothetical protein
MRNSRTGEVQRPPPHVADDLHARRVIHFRGVQRCGRGSNVISGGHPIDRAQERGSWHERLITLNIDDDVVPIESGHRGNLRDPIGA